MIMKYLINVRYFIISYIFFVQLDAVSRTQQGRGNLALRHSVIRVAELNAAL